MCNACARRFAPNCHLLFWHEMPWLCYTGDHDEWSDDRVGYVGAVLYAQSGMDRRRWLLSAPTRTGYY